VGVFFFFSLFIAEYLATKITIRFSSTQVTGLLGEAWYIFRDPFACFQGASLFGATAGWFGSGRPLLGYFTLRPRQNGYAHTTFSILRPEILFNTQGDDRWCVGWCGLIVSVHERGGCAGVNIKFQRLRFIYVGRGGGPRGLW
jgi:hypothetical protein